MPYTKQEDRAAIKETINFLQEYIKSKGDLNYAICQLVGVLILRGKISYTTMSEWIDGVHDAETELRRRILEPYEDLKIKENGDVESFIEILARME
jgi:hypothetical protein